MLITDLGACEWFAWDLRYSNLIDPGQLDLVLGEFLASHPGAEPAALAEFLIGRGLLTSFQAGRLLQGKTQGFLLGPYTLMDTLGCGSMGTVYKARSRTDNQWYAVKVLPRRSMWNIRLARRKVRAFEQCPHPSVVPFADAGTAAGQHYLVWPLVEGEPLDRLVQRQGPLPPEQASTVAVQAAEGLDLCHRQGLFHGQLKPSDLMLGSDGRLRILDFGIGCLLAETEEESLVDTMSTANAINSGLDCASPESILDPTNLTPLGDQYSLGCVLYFCLTGRCPFPGETALEKMMGHQHQEPTPIQELNPAVSGGLVAVVEKLMKKSPADRYPSIAQVIEALGQLTARVQPDLRGMRAPSPPPARVPAALTAPDTPRPTPRPDLLMPGAPAAGPLPARPHLTGQSAPVLPMPAAPPRRTAPAAETPPEQAPLAAERWARGWGPYLVRLSIALSAILAGLAAWLVSSYLPF